MELLIACLIFLWCSMISVWRNHSPLLESREGENSDNICDLSCELEFGRLARIDYSNDPPGNSIVLPKLQDNTK